jgi:group I intron endonuclease
MPDSGVYEIRNSENGNNYIGSAADLNVRLKLHRFYLRRGTHPNRHLQASWNKYGSDAFVFRTMLICASKDTLFYEQRALDVLKPAFNVRRIAHSNLGVKLSAETKAKISALRMGNQHTLGYRHSPESRAKISASKLGNTHTKGKKRDPAAVEKTAAAHRGMKRSVETRTRISVAMTGKKRRPRSTELSAEQVRQIRQQRVQGIARAVIAAAFTTSVEMVSEIVGRRRYGWVQ